MKNEQFSRISIIPLIFWGAVGMVIATYAVHVHWPYNVIALPFERPIASAVNSILPQGWAFFTRSPREEAILVFRKVGDQQWQDTDIGPNAEPSNFFGADRRARAQGLERGIITSSVPDDSWRKCHQELEVCLGLQVENSVTVYNPTPNPTMCGPLALVSRSPVPYSYREHVTERWATERVARVEADCSD